MNSVESKFHVSPFPPFPSAERYVPVGSQEETLQRTSRAIEAWEAISLVIGPPGTGKSLLCQVLRERFSEDREVVVLGDAMLESPATLQKYLLNRLNRSRGIAGEPLGPGEEPQLALIERIASSSSEFAGLLLLVDEAQSLSPEVLETLRILTNVMSDGRPRVSAVLLGGPKLDETLSLPSLESLVQRVATRCYLHPFSSDETVQFVQATIRACGHPPEGAMDEDAIRSVHQACSGVPRLINYLMTAAIEFAATRGETKITTGVIDQAWAVMQQLPSPMLDQPEVSRPVAAVEFGPLSDMGQNETLCAESDPDQAATSNSPIGQTESCEDCVECETVCKQTEEDAKQTEFAGETETCDSECAQDQCAQTCETSRECSGDQACSSGQSGEASIENQDYLTESYTLHMVSDETADSSLAAVSYDCQSFGDLSIDQMAENEACMSDGVQGPCAEQAQTSQDQSTPHDQTTPSENALFGEFDVEEPLTSAPISNGADCETGSDLERSLHDEIIRLREESASHRDSAHGDTANSDSGIHLAEFPATRQSPAPVQWMDDSEDGPLNDDRDLLVIEDDVELEAAVVLHEAPAATEEDATPIAVDFQSMLAKMRAPQG